MATAKKDLTALNSDITIPITGRVAVAGIHYISGAGTIVLEGTIDKVNWFAVGLSTPSDPSTPIAANLAAPGAGYAIVSYCDTVRVRKSVGTAACVVAFCVNTSN